MALTLRRRDPWSAFYNLPNLMDDDWFDSSMQDQGLGMHETDDTVEIEANVAGVPSDQVDVSIEGGTVTIRAEYEEKEEDQQKKKVEYRRRRSAKYLYSISLPTSVDSKKAEATITNGILYLSLPKREEAKPQQIKVKANG